MKRTGFLKRYTPLAAKGGSDTATVKDNIQALLRQIVVRTDGGCIMRFYPEAGPCDGYTKVGDLILQAEHIVTRANSISYADLRNIVCLCVGHHKFFTHNRAAFYFDIIRRHVGEERWAWLQKVEAEYKAHKTRRYTLSDWKKEEAYLKTKLAALA